MSQPKEKYLGVALENDQLVENLKTIINDLPNANLLERGDIDQYLIRMVSYIVRRDAHVFNHGVKVGQGKAQKNDPRK